MAKFNISAGQMLAWDQYKDKPLDDALPSIYEKAKRDAETFPAWYWSSIRTKRLTSLTVRWLTFVLLIVGTVLPVLAGIGENAASKLLMTQIGVCALVVGGLFQVGDRVFGWSSGWLRYITTVTSMENLVRTFELDWARYVLDKGGKLTDTDTKPLFDIAITLQKGLRQLQVDETEAWKSEFNTGATLLSDLIKSQRESSDKAAEAQRAAQKAQEAAKETTDKAKQPGAIELKLVHKTAPIEVKVTLDGGLEESFVGTVWAKTGISPGQHHVTVKTVGASPVNVSKVVDVKPSTTSAVELIVP
ncbi:SLATT domain-containing protein [bacterium]|nr:SLATT domain-containing protein [candidate division CSSED10-310 bacterium]